MGVHLSSHTSLSWAGTFVSERKREREREREREFAQMDVAQFVRLPNGDKVVMGSTPTFHNGI